MSQDSVSEQNHLCVMTLVETAQEVLDACMLLKSLRSFGGPLSYTPVWLFFRPEQRTGDLLDALTDFEGVRFIPLNLDPVAPNSEYLFASKVHSCAQAEAQTSPQTRTLIWLNPGCLIVNPPILFDLAPPIDAAFRPVHHQNIGSPAQRPLDDFWQVVYRSVGLDEAAFTVESFADAQTLRPYFNTHCFSINPTLGLFNAWQHCFQALIDDVSFQSGPCSGPLQRIFLHQAVLSALVAKTLNRERIRILPPEYSYPLHMHPQISPDRRTKRLNDLVCPVYEGAFKYPVTLNGLQVDQPIRSWLQEHGN